MRNLASLVFIALLITSCGGSGSYSTYDDDSGGRYAENPYSDGSGHYAGYEWAERTGRRCGGNSNSFIEGCEEYYRQSGE